MDTSHPQPRSLRGALSIAALAAIACSGGEDTDGGNVVLPVIAPTISAPEPLFQRVAPGETAVVEWTVTWPDGERPEDVAFDIGSFAPSLESTVSELRGGWVEGRSRYRLELMTATRGPYLLELHPRACRTTVCEDLPVVAGEVQVEGGPADAVFPPLAATTLAVGEVRPMTAYPATVWGEYTANPNPNFGERFWSDDPLQFSIDDVAVATVDDAGVVTGIAAGTTTLRIRAGAAEGTVALTVADVPLAAPTGTVHVTDHHVELYEPTWPAGVGPLEGKVAVNERGWPMIAVPMRPGFGPGVDPPFYTQQPPLALARWTGTGFGWEWLGEPSERNYHGVVAVDADGHVWVVLRDQLNNELELWDRAGDVVVGGWNKRRLPIGVDVGQGEVDMSWFLEGSDYEYFPVATLVRPEGGLFIAYANWQAYNNVDADVAWSEQCPRMIRLVTATEDDVQIEVVERSWQLTVQSQGGCAEVFDFAGKIYRRLVLLPSGGPHPTIRALQEVTTTPDPGNLWTWEWTPSGWVGAAALLEGPMTDQDAADLAPILPVEGALDWTAVDDATAPLWAWRDGDGAVRTDDPLTDGSLAERYAGHVVTDTSVSVFVEDYPNTYDPTLGLHTAPR